MKKLTVIILLLTSATCAFSFDFRKTNWGMSMKDVTSSEEDSDYTVNDDATTLTYSVYINGHLGMLIYTFENDKLVSGLYMFDDTFDESVYQEMLDVITGKYGTSNEVTDKEGDWTMTTSYIAVVFTNQVIPGLSGNVCLVYYVERNYEDKIEAQEKAANDSNF